jgi:hypothetical protein
MESGEKTSKEINKATEQGRFTVISPIILDKDLSVRATEKRGADELRKESPAKPLDGPGGTVKEQIVPVRSEGEP